MSILNALSILAGGISKGRVASEEIQRQVEETKRKALLEAREQSLREMLGQSSAGLQGAQATDLTSQSNERNFALQEAQTKAAEESTPLGTTPLHLKLFGNDVTAPNTLAYLSKLVPAAADELRSKTLLGVAGIQGQSRLGVANIAAQARRDAMNIRMTQNISGKHLTPAEMKLHIIEKANQMFSDPDEWQSYIDFARKNLPEAFGAAADSTGGKGAALVGPIGGSPDPTVDAILGIKR